MREDYMHYLPEREDYMTIIKEREEFSDHEITQLLSDEEWSCDNENN